MSLRPRVREALRAHGIEPREGEEAAALRERLNDAYLREVRRLKDRQRAGEIPLRDYAAHVDALKKTFDLLSLPISLWTD